MQTQPPQRPSMPFARWPAVKALCFSFGLTVATTACASALCGDTTVDSSSITGPITEEGVAVSYETTDVSAFSDSITAGWTRTGHQYDEEILRVSFKTSPLTQGSFALETQGAQFCMGPSACMPVTGTLVVSHFVVDPCGNGPSNIGCPTHLDADVQGAVNDGKTLTINVHLHVDGKRTPYKGCVGDRIGK
jgi:hypothetical protein